MRASFGALGRLVAEPIATARSEAGLAATSGTSSGADGRPLHPPVSRTIRRPSEAGPAAPSPFAPDAAWQAWREARRRGLPSWHVDRDFVTSHALELLPRVLAELGCGELVTMLPRPRWWFAYRVPEEVAARHGTRLQSLQEGIPPILMVRLTATKPGAPRDTDILYVDQATGEWACPNLCRCGDDLVALAAWRLGLSEGKAAWRLARICGLGRPTR